MLALKQVGLGVPGPPPEASSPLSSQRPAGHSCPVCSPASSVPGMLGQADKKRLQEFPVTYVSG